MKKEASSKTKKAKSTTKVEFTSSEEDEADENEARMATGDDADVSGRRAASAAASSSSRQKEIASRAEMMAAEEEREEGEEDENDDDDAFEVDAEGEEEDADGESVEELSMAVDGNDDSRGRTTERKHLGSIGDHRSDHGARTESSDANKNAANDGSKLALDAREPGKKKSKNPDGWGGLPNFKKGRTAELSGSASKRDDNPRGRSQTVSRAATPISITREGTPTNGYQSRPTSTSASTERAQRPLTNNNSTTLSMGNGGSSSSRSVSTTGAAIEIRDDADFERYSKQFTEELFPAYLKLHEHLRGVHKFMEQAAARASSTYGDKKTKKKDDDDGGGVPATERSQSAAELARQVEEVNQRGRELERIRSAMMQYNEEKARRFSAAASDDKLVEGGSVSVSATDGSRSKGGAISLQGARAAVRVA